MRLMRRGFLWIGLSFALATCSSDKPKPQNGPPPGSGTQGLMNFRQIRAAWASATGLDPYTKDLEDTFKSLQDRLLTNHALDQLTQPVVSASIGLGAAFCRSLVDREANAEASERRFFGALALDGEPEDSALRNAAERLTAALWRRPMGEEESAEFVALGRDIYRMGSQKPNASPASASRETWLSLCTAAGAAVDGLTL